MKNINGKKEGNEKLYTCETKTENTPSCLGSGALDIIFLTNLQSFQKHIFLFQGWRGQSTEFIVNIKIIPRNCLYDRSAELLGTHIPSPSSLLLEGTEPFFPFGNVFLFPITFPRSVGY